MDDLVAVVLAAGAGTRLRPLTQLLPKALCPVAGRPLLDMAIERARRVTKTLAVNVHHGRAAVEQHLTTHHAGVHISVEEAQALGTAGALGALKSWIDGRATLVVNADAWHGVELSQLLDAWEGHRARLLVVGPEPGRRADFTRDGSALTYAGAALMPWSDVAALAAAPAGLYEASWAAHERAGTLELHLAEPAGSPWFDCGTPSHYLAANLTANGGASFIDAQSQVEGRVERSVVWPRARVDRHEHLVECIRAVGPDGEPMTVPAPLDDTLRSGLRPTPGR